MKKDLNTIRLIAVFKILIFPYKPYFLVLMKLQPKMQDVRYILTNLLFKPEYSGSFY